MTVEIIDTGTELSGQSDGGDADVDTVVVNGGDAEAERAGDREACGTYRSHAVGFDRLVVLTAAVVVVALGVLAAWQGYRAHQYTAAAAQRAKFLQAARQVAINLTSVDFHHADADVQRVLDSATGSFYDDFAKRSQPFLAIVKKIQSKSEGAVTLAGLESVRADRAQVLVAMTVTTTNAGAQQGDPRAWRMRIVIQKVGSDLKVSSVEFVR